MKNYIFILITGSVLLFLNACKKLDGIENFPNNAVYMGNPNPNGTIAMVVSNDKGGSAVVTPRLANVTQEPVKITVAIDEKVLQDYNKANGLELMPFDPKDFVFVTADGKKHTGEAIATIEKGNFQTSIEIKIDSLDEAKYPYSKSFAIPVIIKDATTYQLLSAPKWTIVQLNRMLKTSVGLMSGGNIVLMPKTPFAEPMKEWTFQMSMIYSSLTRSNLTTAYIKDAGGGALYTRINSTQGIQIKNGRDGDDTWTQKPLQAGVWLNISYVYREGSVSVYVNGVLQKTFLTTPLYLAATAASGWVIGNEGYDNDYIREVRFWNRALSEGEITDKLYLPRDPKTPGLLMYMPVTKETEITELTGNWNVTKGSTTKISYIDNVLFPADKLVIAE